MLAVAVAAGDVGVVGDDRLPEELRDLGELLVAGELVDPRGADGLGNLRVGVLAAELVAALGQRVEHRRGDRTSWRAPGRPRCR